MQKEKLISSRVEREPLVTLFFSNTISKSLVFGTVMGNEKIASYLLKKIDLAEIRISTCENKVTSQAEPKILQLDLWLQLPNTEV